MLSRETSQVQWTAESVHQLIISIGCFTQLSAKPEPTPLRSCALDIGFHRLESLQKDEQTYQSQEEQRERAHPKWQPICSQHVLCTSAAYTYT